MHIAQTTVVDRPQIEQLLDTAFGPDRQQKSAYRLREGSRPVEALCFTVHDGAQLCASIEFWPIALVAEADGAATPALLLGPIAVAESCRGRGIGGLLIHHGLERARALGHKLVLLVGDPEYYERFGFTNAPTGGWRMPGPVEQRRVMARLLDDTLALPAAAAISKPAAATSAPLAHPGEAEAGSHQGPQQQGGHDGRLAHA